MYSLLVIFFAWIPKDGHFDIRISILNSLVDKILTLVQYLSNIGHQLIADMF